MRLPPAIRRRLAAAILREIRLAPPWNRDVDTVINPDQDALAALAEAGPVRWGFVEDDLYAFPGDRVSHDMMRDAGLDFRETGVIDGDLAAGLRGIEASRYGEPPAFEPDELAGELGVTPETARAVLRAHPSPRRRRIYSAAGGVGLAEMLRQALLGEMRQGEYV